MEHGIFIPSVLVTVNWYLNQFSLDSLVFLLDDQGLLLTAL